MTDTTDTRARLEAFFRRRSDDPDSVKVVDYQLITGGYSRQMSRVWVEDGGAAARLHRAPGPAAGPGDHRHRPGHRVGGALDAAPVGPDPDAGAAVVRSDGRGARQPGHRHRDVRRRGARQRWAASATRASCPSSPPAWPRSAARWRRSRWRRRRPASRCRRRGTTTSTPASSTGSTPRRKHVDRDPFMRLIAAYLQVEPAAAGAARARARRLPDRQRPARHRRDRRPRRLGADPHRRPARGPRLVHDGQRHPAARRRRRRRGGVLRPLPRAQRAQRGAGQPDDDRLLPPARLVDGVRQRASSSSPRSTEGETTGIQLAYMSPAVSGMHDVFYRALKRHAAATGGAT